MSRVSLAAFAGLASVLRLALMCGPGMEVKVLISFLLFVGTENEPASYSRDMLLAEVPRVNGTWKELFMTFDIFQIHLCLSNILSIVLSSYYIAKRQS